MYIESILHALSNERTLTFWRCREPADILYKFFLTSNTPRFQGPRVSNKDRPPQIREAYGVV